MFLISSCSCLCPIYWSQALSQEWRCGWSNADRRCSNYIWVINNFISYQGAAYNRGLTVHVFSPSLRIWLMSCRVFCCRPPVRLCSLNTTWKVELTYGKFNNVKWNSTLNSLWPSDVIWRQGSRSTLAQVMACCLTAPSHYLNQCWLNQ